MNYDKRRIDGEICYWFFAVILCFDWYACALTFAMSGITLNYDLISRFTQFARFQLHKFKSKVLRIELFKYLRFIYAIFIAIFMRNFN